MRQTINQYIATLRRMKRFKENRAYIFLRYSRRVNGFYSPCFEVWQETTTVNKDVIVARIGLEYADGQHRVQANMLRPSEVAKKIRRWYHETEREGEAVQGLGGEVKTIEDARNVLSLCEQGPEVAGAQLVREGIPCILCCACCSVPTMLIWTFPELAEEWEKMKEGK